MTGWVFTYGVDGFGMDTAPAHEQGVYLDFDKAFKRLCELNAKGLKDSLFYEEGYGEDFYPKNDKEMAKAEDDGNWELYEKLLKKHMYTDIKRFCKENCLTGEPGYGYYAIEQIEIYE